MGDIIDPFQGTASSDGGIADPFKNGPVAAPAPPPPPNYAGDVGSAVSSGVSELGRSGENLARSLVGGVTGYANKAGLVSDETKNAVDEANVQAIGANQKASENQYQPKTLPGEVASGLVHMAPAIGLGLLNPVAGVAAFGGQGAWDAGTAAVDQGGSLANAQMKAVGQGALNTALGEVVGGAGNKVLSKLPVVGGAFEPAAADTVAGVGKRMVQGAGTMAAFKPAGTAIDYAADTATNEKQGKNYEFMPNAADLLTGALMGVPHAGMEFFNRNKMPEKPTPLADGSNVLMHSNGSPFSTPDAAQSFIDNNKLDGHSVVPISQKSFDPTSTNTTPIGYAVKPPGILEAAALAGGNRPKVSGLLPNYPAQTKYAFSDGSTGTKAEVDELVNSYPPEEQNAVRANVMHGAQEIQPIGGEPLGDKLVGAKLAAHLQENAPKYDPTTDPLKAAASAVPTTGVATPGEKPGEPKPFSPDIQNAVLNAHANEYLRGTVADTDARVAGAEAQAKEMRRINTLHAILSTPSIEDKEGAFKASLTRAFPNQKPELTDREQAVIQRHDDITSAFANEPTTVPSQPNETDMGVKTVGAKSQAAPKVDRIEQAQKLAAKKGNRITDNGIVDRNGAPVFKFKEGEREKIDALNKEGENAIQKPSTGEVLQREPGQAGEGGGERGRVEPSEQGGEAAQEGQPAAKAGGETPNAEHLIPVSKRGEYKQIEPTETITVHSNSHGVATNELMLAKTEDGKWLSAVSAYDSTGGTSSPLAHSAKHDTRQEAINAAVAHATKYMKDEKIIAKWKALHKEEKNAQEPKVPANRQQLFVIFGGKKYPVDSIQDASEKWNEFRNATGAGASEIGSDVPILDESGKQLAYISYNGKVWAGKSEDWKSSDEPIYDGNQKPTKPATPPPSEHPPGATNAQKSGEAPNEKAEAPLALGKTPNATEPITVKNGVIYMGEHPALDYESGEDVKIRDGATSQEIKDALTKAGAVSKGYKFFGGEKAEPTKNGALKEYKELADALERYDGTGEIATIADFVDEVERLVDEGLAPKSLLDAVDDYRNEEKEDRALSGRGDMGAAENKFIDAVKAATNRPTITSAKEADAEFKRQTGLTIQAAKATLAGIEVRNTQRKEGNLAEEAETHPFTKEQDRLIALHDSFAKTSHYLFHTTKAENLAEISKNGLTTNNQARQEGVSGAGKISLAANEEHAKVYGGSNDVMLRVKKGHVFDDIEADHLAGDGAYTTGKNIPPESLEIKEGGKWVPLKEHADIVAKEKAKQQVTAQRNVHNDAFKELNGIQGVLDASDPTVSMEKFKGAADEEIRKWSIKAIKDAKEAGETDRLDALNALVGDDGKVNLPDDFYTGMRKEAQRNLKQAQTMRMADASKDALAEAAKDVGVTDQVSFAQGWNHALQGKTKSTLPNGEAFSKGYEAAKAWIKTPDGQAAYTGKRAKKLENTGADLRRWYELQKAKIKDGDTDAVMAAIENATARADLFRNVVPPDATPGATRWLEAFRNRVYPFKRWIAERGILSNSVMSSYIRRSVSDAERIRGYLDGNYSRTTGEETREQRIQSIREAADEYAQLIGDLTERLKGGTVEELATSLDNAIWKKDVSQPSRWNDEHYAEGGKQIAEMINDFTHAIRNYGWINQSYTVRNLRDNEAQTIESTRKAALTPPRLDRVDRAGEDFRKGKNITPEEAKRTFNFGDIGFGKWVGAKQDQDHLNYAYDAFRDLADLMGIPPEAISLGGQLHFTIGALGHNKFAAHYQPEQPHPNGGTVPVINVTNTKGDGTVAHEWSHALDLTPVPGRTEQEVNNFRRAISEIKNNLQYGYDITALRRSVVSMLKGESWWNNDKRAKKTEEGRIENAIRAIDHYSERARNLSKYYQEAVKLDGSNANKKPYWSNDKELFARAFEAWTGDKLPETNTYLVNPAWSGDGAVTGKTHRGTPYPMNDERERFNSWFDALAKSLKYDADRKVLLLDKGKWEDEKPKTDADWKAELQRLKDSLPEMLKAIDREKMLIEQQRKDAEAHAETMKAGDWVVAREGTHTNFGMQTDNTPKPILKKVSGAIYFEGVNHPDFAHNFIIVRRKDEAEQIAKADANNNVNPKIEPAGELSEADLSALFDEVAAEMQEQTQEQPEAPAPGAALDNMSDQVSAGEGQKAKENLLNDSTLSEQFEKDWDAIGYGGRQSIAEASGIGGMRNVVHRISGSKWAELSPGEQTSMRDAARKLNKEKAANLLSGRSGKVETDADRTASALAAEAAKQGVTGINEALKGLAKLFGAGKNKLSSFPGGLDKEAYEQAKPHFEAALKKFQDAGKSIKDLLRYLIESFGLGIKPYFIHFARESKLTASLGENPSATRKVANFVTDALRTGKEIRWQQLFEEADKAWDGTQAEGKYTVKDAYDAMEAGVNQWIRDHDISTDVNAEDAASNIRGLNKVIEKLPTQTKRTAEHDEYQQFSTPPALAYLANWVANVGRADTAMEPSAGTGDLAIWAEKAGAKLILNELSSRRASILKELFPDARVFTENAEQINNTLPKDAKPSVVIMNPPFSSTAGRVEGSRSNANGAQHVEQALKRLENGGRLVAITGGLPKEWIAKIQKSYNIRAMIDISGKEYAKYGTTFDNKIIVIDKDGKTANDILKGRVESVAELPALLEGIRNDRPEITEQSRAEQDRSDAAEKNRLDAESQDGSRGGATDAVGAGEGDIRPDADLGDGGQLQRPGAGLAGDHNDTGKTKSGRADEVSDDNRLGGQQQPGSGQDKSGAGSGNANGRDDSGNKGKPGAPASGVALSKYEKVEHKTELTNSIFDDYKPQRLNIPGAKDHPGKLVQSAAMAAVDPPEPTYTPNLPKEVIDKGLLSLSQLESVVYAGMAHGQKLPNGERRGFFIGDGTGVGKGREISGIIMDNMRQGQKKALWISFSEGLINDAKRDYSGIGGDKDQIFWQGKTKSADKIAAKDGILFTSYYTLSSGGGKKQATDLGQKAGQTRLNQIVDWLGKDYSGVIVFDEAHSMGNSTPVKGKRGTTKPSQQALTGLELQRMLPDARIVYVSATGATEINNLGYASRLGLWGEGTAFPDVRSFIGGISTGGVASMELISRDMKALGMYVARSLSFDGVTYQRLEHQLTPLQNDIYNELAKAWQGVLQNVNDALEITKGAKSGKAKSAAMGAFWGSHQRFFNQVITSLQTPSVIGHMREQIKEGKAVVVQLVNTNEATQEREVAKAHASGQDLEEMDFTPRQMLMDYVRNSFPVQAYEESTDDQGNVIHVPVTDSEGNPVFDKEAIAMRDKLLETLEQIRVPENPIDAILREFGPEQVGEVTGRGRRFVQQRDEDGNLKLTEEKRGKNANYNDATAFQNDEKKILVFSGAGGTGYSFHSDLGAKNQRQRTHYILQPGWRADSAVQGFGRTHRTNQANEPMYVLPTTNLKAQKRFVSSIARRLDQLGALTKGERKTTGQGLFSASDNLESSYAEDALESLFQDMYRGSTPLNFVEVTREMGLDNLIDQKTGGLNTTNIPEIPKFLNRLLSLESHRQDEVFGEFEKRMEEIVAFAQQNGTYDNGMQTLKAESIKKVRDEVAHTDERTGAQTRYVEADVTNPIKYRDWKNAQEWKNQNPDKFDGWYVNGKWETLGIRDMGERVNADGKTTHRAAVIDVRDGRVRYIDNLDEIRRGFRYNKSGQKIPLATKHESEDAAKAAWEKQVENSPKTETNRERMIVGAILPIWDRVEGHPRIYRMQTDEGERMIGRVMGEKDATATLKNLGLGSSTSKMSPKDQLDRIHKGDTAILANGWDIKKVTVSNDKRLEITKVGYFTGPEQAQLKEQGAFIERIGWTERVFIPVGENEQEVFERITKSKPVVDLVGGKKESGEESPSYNIKEGASGEIDAKTEPAYHASNEELETVRKTIEADTKEPFGALKNAQLPDAVSLGKLAAAFGKKVVGIEPQDPKQVLDFNGAVLKNALPDLIFLNKDADRPHLAIMGHELVHHLRATDKLLYDRFYAAVKPFAKENYAEFYAKMQKGGNTNADSIREEFLAEVVSDGFMNEKFWDAMGKKAPNILSKIYGIARSLMDKAARALGYSNKTEKYLSDFDKVMKIAGKVMAEYGQKVSEGKYNKPDDSATSDIRYNLKEKAATAADKLRARESVKSASEAIDGLKRVVMPQYRTVDAREVGRILTAGMGEKEMQNIKFRAELNNAIKDSEKATTTLAKARDLIEKGLTVAADKMFLRQSPEENHAFMQAMDTGDVAYFKAHPELKGMADVISKMFTDKARQVQALDTGALQTVRESYFSHIWNREPTGDKMHQIYSTLAKRPLEGQKSFTRQRVFEDVNAGLDAGFEPISHNPLDLVALKMEEMDKYILAHKTLSELEKGSSAVSLVDAGEMTPAGFSDVNGRFGFITRNGQKMRYVARDDVAQVINNYISPSLYHNKYVGKPFSAYMGAANALNHFQLGVFSAFHAGFTSFEAVISHASIGVKALSNGDFKGAGKYLAEAPLAWFNNPRMGDKIIKAMLSGNDPQTKEMAAILQGLQLAGFKWQMDSRFRPEATKKMLTAWQEGKQATAALHGINAMVEQSARPIVEWLVPRQKFGVFGEMMNKWMHDNPNATHEEMRNSAQQIWNRVDSRLGLVVYDRLFVHNVAKNFAQMLVRAPGWTGGTILEVGGGMKDLAKYAADLAAGKNPKGISDRAAYTLSMLAVTAIANALLTAMFTGDSPKDWRDLVAFRTGNMDEKGRPERFMLPTYMKDVYAYANAPGETLLHKSHPLLSVIGDVVHNRDYYGTEIRSEDDDLLTQLLQTAGYAAKAFTPFWIRGVQKEQQRGGSATATALPFVGAMPAPTSLNKSAAENLISKYGADRLPAGSRTQEEEAKKEAQDAIYAAMRRGNRDKAMELFKTAQQQGILTAKDFSRELKASKKDTVVNSFSHLTYAQAQRVMAVATEDEKKQLRMPFLKKQMAERRNNPIRAQQEAAL